MSDDRLSDDEVLLRRIPPGSPYFEPPDRITSANFKLRSDEDGLSVYRERLVSVEQLLQRPETPPGSFVVKATVAEIRQAKNGKGDSLKLDVLPVGHEKDPGHAEICGKFSSSVATALKQVFVKRGRFLSVESPPSPRAESTSDTQNEVTEPTSGSPQPLANELWYRKPG